ncbi:MAG: dihydrolipoamide acetyltransferase family protein [Gemmatimonadetes bacterium]|nr:dihydrolipoamide acetyltransferase family protein [Gemmatimonadota bacterium]MDE2734008.1 dihydrolipoamide acetyltransferase family protein [Gemmatimonadota bacterium]
MATEIVMPKLGLTMESGAISAWLVEEGQEVQKGQALLEIATDKVTMEVEAQADGILRKILVPVGQEVPVSTTIGVIAAADEDIDSYVAVAPSDPVPTAAPSDPTPPATPTPAAPPTPASPTPAPQAPAPSADSDGRRPHKTSPKARKIAAEHGLDLSGVNGSGPGGRIVSADVLALVEQARLAPAPTPAAPVAEGLIELSRAEQVAAERLTASYQQIPHIHISMDVSAVWLQQFRTGYQLEGKKISFNDLIVKATARTLREFPRVNSLAEGDHFRYASQINIGVAVAAEQGLVVPVIRDAAEKTVEEIALEGTRLIDAARRGELGPDDMLGGTFTISNLGMFGVSRFTAIINPPQVAILAVGAIENRVVASGADAFAVRPQLTLTLAADHRVVDGALAARFLARLKEVLETPGLLG